MSEPRWLSPDERTTWLELLEFVAGLPRAVDRQLARDASMSTGEYSVLAAVSEESEEGIRSGDLARIMDWEKSRLSHLLRRMESKGLISRCAASNDARGQQITLTDLGWQTVVKTAPSHVEMVRTNIFDPLDETEQHQLRESLRKIRTAMEKDSLW